MGGGGGSTGITVVGGGTGSGGGAVIGGGGGSTGIGWLPQLSHAGISAAIEAPSIARRATFSSVRDIVAGRAGVGGTLIVAAMD